MNNVAHHVMTSNSWAVVAGAGIALYCVVSGVQTYVHVFGGDLRRVRSRLRLRARLALDKTGFIGAVLARHTLLVTLNVLVFSLSLNLLSASRAANVQSMSADVLETGLSILAGFCLFLVVVIATMTFALCNAVVRLAEPDA